VLKLEQIQKNAAITGLEPGHVVRIVTTEPVGDNALTVYYKTADGKLLERMLFRRRVALGHSTPPARTSSSRPRPTGSTWRTYSIR